MSCRLKLHPKMLINQMSVCELHDSTGESTSQVKRLKLFKRLFSTALFGATLATAIYIKRKRTSELKSFLNDSKRLPIDENYESKDAQHMYLYKDYVLHISHLKVLQEMSDFQSRSDDIYIVAFPKAGTTWVQEIVYLIGTNLNYERAISQLLETRFPYLEHVYPGWKSIDKLPSMRFIKSHLPYSLLPQDIKDKNCKIIYVARNPKDVLVSYYFFLRMLTVVSYRGTLAEYFKKFLKNEVFYGPFWNHVLEFWNQRDSENILFVKYEDLHKDLIGEIKRIAAFLDKSITDAQISALVHHVSFEEMAGNVTVNHTHFDDLGLRHKDESTFYRKGIVGDWKNYFTTEMNETMDAWIRCNTGESDLNFNYE